jgi:hypothetical protein
MGCRLGAADPHRARTRRRVLPPWPKRAACAIIANGPSADAVALLHRPPPIRPAARPTAASRPTQSLLPHDPWHRAAPEGRLTRRVLPAVGARGTWNGARLAALAEGSRCFAAMTPRRSLRGHDALPLRTTASTASDRPGHITMLALQVAQAQHHCKHSNSRVMVRIQSLACKLHLPRPGADSMHETLLRLRVNMLPAVLSPLTTAHKREIQHIAVAYLTSFRARRHPPWPLA